MGWHSKLRLVQGVWWKLKRIIRGQKRQRLVYICQNSSMPSMMALEVLERISSNWITFPTNTSYEYRDNWPVPHPFGLFFSVKWLWADKSELQHSKWDLECYWINLHLLPRWGDDEEGKRWKCESRLGSERLLMFRSQKSGSQNKRTSSQVRLLELRRMQGVMPNLIKVMLPLQVLALNLTNLTSKDVSLQFC